MLGRLFRKPGQNEKVPPGQSLTERFPVLTYGPVPHVDTQSVSVRVFGLGQPRESSFADLKAMPQTTLTRDIHCVTHWSKLETEWSGVSVPDFMSGVELDPRATHVLVHSYGGYTTNLELADFLRPDNLLTYTYAGQPLEREHGGPLRLLVPHLYLWKSAKWLSGFEFMDHEQLGFWERNGYHRRGDPFKQERYSDD